VRYELHFFVLFIRILGFGVLISDTALLGSSSELENVFTVGWPESHMI